MHIQPEQFIALLSEASGIEEDKVRKQLNELITEIKHTVEEGEAYELEEFGIFSQLGDRLVFIPSPALETEINFKYVGMEPIEMEAPAEDDKEEKDAYDPFEGLAMDDDSKSSRDPFSGLIEELDEDEIPESTEQEEVMEADPEPVAEDSSNNTDDFDDPFAELEEGPAEPKGIELPDEEEVEDEEEAPGPLQWGISAHSESDESADRLVSSLMGDNTDEETLPDTEDAFEDPFTDEDDDEITETFDPEKTLQDDLENVLNDEETDNFEDPFAGIDDDHSDSAQQHEDDDSDDDSDDDEDILPVITNISSDLPEPEEKPEKEKKSKPRKEKSDKKGEPAPLWLWAVLFVVVIGGGVFALQYFEIIRIPGISQDEAVTQAQPVSPQPQTQATPEQNEPKADTNIPDEPEPTPVPAESSSDLAQPITEADDGSGKLEDPSETPPVNMPETVPDDQSLYGLTGVASNAANNGYTIVLYSLSVEENALREQARLQQRGYRALVKPVSSSQYGTLWRVSIGQFASQRDAAIATDQLDDSFNQNIFISKITN